MSAMTRTEKAQQAAVHFDAQTIQYTTARLVMESAPLKRTPLQDWLDDLPEEIATVSMHAEVKTGFEWHVYLLNPQEPLHTWLMKAKFVGISHMEKSLSYDGRTIKWTGKTAEGETVMIHGYLGSCQIETYEELVTKTRVVCGDAEEGEGATHG
jgi:hypothetical protein